MFLDFCCRCHFITGCFLIFVCRIFLYADASWLWYSLMFCIRIFHYFVTMCCFTSRYSMTLVQCVILYPNIPWLWYNVLFYIPIFCDFVIMCCFTSRYSMTLLLCVVLYPDIPWLCYYVLFYIRCVLTKIRSFDDTIHLISQLSCWLEWLIRLISFNSLSKFLFMCGVRFFQA